MPGKPLDAPYTDKEIERRMNAAVRKALTTPAHPKIKKEKAKLAPMARIVSKTAPSQRRKHGKA